MSIKSKVLVISCLLCASTGYSASPQDSMFDGMTEQLSIQMKATLKMMNDPELIKLNAQYIKNLYDALLKEGFTKDQALQIVVANITNKN